MRPQGPQDQHVASLPGSRPHGNPLLAAGKGAGEEERVPITHWVSAEVSMSFYLTFHWCELSHGQPLPPKEAGDVVSGYVVLHPVKMETLLPSGKGGGYWEPLTRIWHHFSIPDLFLLDGQLPGGL